MKKTIKTISLKVTNSGTKAHEINLFDYGSKLHHNFGNDIDVMVTGVSETSYMEFFEYIGNVPVLIKAISFSNSEEEKKFKKVRSHRDIDFSFDIDMPFNENLEHFKEYDRFMENSKIVFEIASGFDKTIVCDFEILSFTKEELEFIEQSSYTGIFDNPYKFQEMHTRSIIEQHEKK